MEKGFWKGLCEFFIIQSRGLQIILECLAEVYKFYSLPGFKSRLYCSTNLNFSQSTVQKYVSFVKVPIRAF